MALAMYFPSGDQETTIPLFGIDSTFELPSVFTKKISVDSEPQITQSPSGEQSRLVSDVWTVANVETSSSLGTGIWRSFGTHIIGELPKDGLSDVAA